MFQEEMHLQMVDFEINYNVGLGEFWPFSILAVRIWGYDRNWELHMKRNPKTRLL